MPPIKFTFFWNPLYKLTPVFSPKIKSNFLLLYKLYFPPYGKCILLKFNEILLNSLLKLIISFSFVNPKGNANDILL